jgi:hypothetical protein
MRMGRSLYVAVWLAVLLFAVTRGAPYVAPAYRVVQWLQRGAPRACTRATPWPSWDAARIYLQYPAALHDDHSPVLYDTRIVERELAVPVRLHAESITLERVLPLFALCRWAERDAVRAQLLLGRGLGLAIGSGRVLVAGF